MSDSNGIKDGTVLPVAYESSPGHRKRNKKSGRRRN